MSQPLRLIHTADAHGSSAVFERLKNTLHPQNDLLLDAGDAIRGSNTLFHWREPNLKHLSVLGCGAMAMGNRELHYLPRVLEERASQRDFPLLAANLVELWGRPTTWREGTTIVKAGLRIGVFGMTVVQYPVGSFYERLFGLRFLPPQTLIEPLVEQYQQNHDLVIFLSHLGIAKDRELLQQLAKKPRLKLDLTLGGHSHTLLERPERYGSCWLSHVGSHGQGYGLWTTSSPSKFNYRYCSVATVSQPEYPHEAPSSTN